MRRLLTMAGLIGLMLAMLATPAIADDHSVSGTMTVSPGSTNGVTVEQYNGKPCTGSDVSAGFDDISQGAVVIVRDDKGKRIATGVLGAGHSNDLLECIFKFKVSVPAAKLYTFEVSKRGELAYSAKKLAAAHYHVALSLTDNS